MTLRVISLMGEQAADAARAAVPDVEVVVLGFGDPLPDDLRGDVLFGGWHGHPAYDRLDEIGVRWIHLPGTGIDGWPRPVLEGRLVTCSRGLSAIPISEFVMASILAFVKDFPSTWLREPPEHWNLASFGELAGQTVGLVGLGGIGGAVATRAQAFDMPVRALRRNASLGAPDGVELAADLTDLLASADHLVLAAPGTDATHHLLDADAFARVKPGMHLVNIARGSLVDQDALRVALDDGRVARASLDTVDPEPLPAGHWLYEHPSVRLSAHVSWTSPRAFDRMIEVFAENLARFAADEPLDGVIDLDAGY